MFPVWTSDGARVIFRAAPDSAGRRLLAWQVADGSAPKEDLLSVDPGGTYRPYHVSGSTLVLGHNDDLKAFELRTGSSGVQTRTSPELRALLETSFVEQNAEVSPDGRWLAYQSNESGRDEIYVRPLPNLERARWLVSTNGGRTPLWARGGEELFYGTPDGAVMSVRVHPGVGWQHDAAVQVVRPGYFHAGEVHRTFDVSGDGERFLMIKQIANAGDARRSIVVVQNWFEELKRLVPTE
jgi:serine/threonine-protein kinase